MCVDGSKSVETNGPISLVAGEQVSKGEHIIVTLPFLYDTRDGA